MGYDRVLPQTLGQLVGHPLHQPSGVDEDQGCLVGLDQAGHPVKGLAPGLVAGDGAQFPFGKLDGQVDLPGVAGVDNQTVRSPIGPNVVASHQEPPHFVDGALGRRQPDADDRLFRQRAETFHRQRQMSASFVVGHGVNLVQDEGADPGQT